MKRPRSLLKLKQNQKQPKRKKRANPRKLNQQVKKFNQKTIQSNLLIIEESLNYGFLIEFHDIFTQTKK